MLLHVRGNHLLREGRSRLRMRQRLLSSVTVSCRAPEHTGGENLWRDLENHALTVRAAVQSHSINIAIGPDSRSVGTPTIRAVELMHKRVGPLVALLWGELKQDATVKIGR